MVDPLDFWTRRESATVECVTSKSIKQKRCITKWNRNWNVYVSSWLCFRNRGISKTKVWHVEYCKKQLNDDELLDEKNCLRSFIFSLFRKTRLVDGSQLSRICGIKKYLRTGSLLKILLKACVVLCCLVASGG